MALVNVLRTFCALGLLLALNSQCSPLTPYSKVRQSVPQSEFVRIGEQWVHFESQGDGIPVVFLHGFGGSTYSWREVLPKLPEHGYRAVAIDLNGFGYTERPISSKAYSVAGQRDLVVRVMDALSIEQAHLVGHSYGAGIALRIAGDHPARVKSLTLVDGGSLSGGGGGPSIPEILKPLLLFWVQNFALRESSIRDLLEDSVHRKEIISDEVVEAYLKRLRVEGLDDALYGLSARSSPLPSLDVSKLTVPSRILWGVHDTVIPIRVGEELASKIPGTMLIRFEESGHLPMEEQPAEFLAAVHDFLVEVP